MKYFYLLLASMLIFSNSCRKEEDFTQMSNIDKSEVVKQSAPTSTTIYNPIVGKWELGSFKMLCLGVTDTTIYPNERGDFVEFQKTDTAFYTFNTLNSTGWTPYKILDSSRFILGDTMQIISYDGVRLTTYCKSSNGGSQQWMTYKKTNN